MDDAQQPEQGYFLDLDVAAPGRPNPCDGLLGPNPAWDPEARPYCFGNSAMSAGLAATGMKGMYVRGPDVVSTRFNPRAGRRLPAARRRMAHRRHRERSARRRRSTCSGSSGGGSSGDGGSGSSSDGDGEPSSPSCLNRFAQAELSNSPRRNKKCLGRSSR